VDKCQDVYFKTGSELTALVKAESDRLRSEGVDFIVYTIHDGYGNTQSGAVTPVTGSQIASYYDISLSDGYVDLVFEGHTHQGYRLQDEYGVYHLQNRGDNKGGISHVEVAINTVDYSSSVRVAELVSVDKYKNLSDDSVVEELLNKYGEQISVGQKVVGYNSRRRSGNELRQLVADLYFDAGMERWGEDYDIVLGGGFVSVRSPNQLAAGDVTYAMLQSLFPFDNQLTLCSVKGRDLWNKFLNTDNSNYFISYGEYGAEVYSNIDMNATYYLITDSYSALYGPNKLTVVAEYDEGVYARDLLADYIGEGGLSN
jgi:2',3'-cyclic-nucleotide 2'-phosphodiesterase (5'-nucleotidase family)